MSASIARQQLETWADTLLEHSLGGITPRDVVMLKGEPITWPLLSMLQDKVFAQGAIADVNLVAPDNDRGKVWGASIARHGTAEQIARVPDWHGARYAAMTKYVELLGAESPELFADLPQETARALARADEPYKTTRLLKPWVITLYPTPGFARLEGLTLDEYREVVVAASTVDPRGLEAVQRPIRDAMRESRTLRIVTEHPRTRKRLELSIDIAGRKVVMCTGKRNLPDGEVFTSPDARRTEGELFLDLPVFQGGAVIQGVYLRFAGGRIVEYSAERGAEALARIVETDEGSHRLGEAALGMNSGLRRVLCHPLFVEKTGGTVHVAVGSSYAECFVDDPASEAGRARCDELAAEGVLNRSAQHVDLVSDFRPGGAGREVWLDDVRLAVEDGIWVVPSCGR